MNVRFNPKPNKPEPNRDNEIVLRGIGLGDFFCVTTLWQRVDKNQPMLICMGFAIEELYCAEEEAFKFKCTGSRMCFRNSMYKKGRYKTGLSV